MLTYLGQVTSLLKNTYLFIVFPEFWFVYSGLATTSSTNLAAWWSLVSSMDTLEEDLTCSVCYSLFSDPRVLPCSHTFCKACLDSVLQALPNYSIWRPIHQPLKCPICRCVVELSMSSVDALPTNVCLQAIIEKDRQLICGLCLTVGRHKNHLIDDLQAAFIREKQAPAVLLARLSDKTWDMMCGVGEQLEKEKARCESVVRKDRQEVTQFFHNLEVVLARKRQSYLEVLDTTCAEVTRAYDPLIHRVKELQEEQVELVSLASSIEEEELPLVFLEKVHQFRERVDKFTKASLPSVLSLSITPRAADYLQQHWPAITLASLEEAPVPKVCCCVRCGNMDHLPASEGSVRDLCFRPAILVIFLLLLLLASHGLDHFSHGQLLPSLWAWLESTWGVTLDLVERWSLHVASLGEMLVVQLNTFFSPLDLSAFFTT
ncbi:tripartite motif-containing protein 59 isoform X3 [Entelurus aequoreus]|uniref:tripartite motif-containing protein 59 isoform X3 n=1 Tax=Entelurus aequoreus TaxID=161455 RepID=UPI002B1D1838|nr:tripartite motif-containing protein 59 isoform X3 [Entelurus aequoreus]